MSWLGRTPCTVATSLMRAVVAVAGCTTGAAAGAACTGVTQADSSASSITTPTGRTGERRSIRRLDIGNSADRAARKGLRSASG